MKFNLKKILYGFKEYFVLILLLMISLVLQFIIKAGESTSVQKIKAYGFASIAVFNSMITSFSSLFRDDTELQKQRKLNAELMLELNLLREHALENESLRNLLDYRDTSKYSVVPAKVVSKPPTVLGSECRL